MKIKSTLAFNTSLLSAHSPSVKNGQVVIGGGVSVDLNIPAGATLEVDDAKWKKFWAEPAADHIEAGYLVIVEGVKLTAAEQKKEDAAELAKLEARTAALKKKA